MEFGELGTKTEWENKCEGNFVGWGITLHCGIHSNGILLVG